MLRRWFFFCTFLGFSVAVVAGLVLSGGILHFARERFDLLWFNNSHQLATQVIAEEREEGCHDNLLVVYNNPDCPKSVLLQAIVLPSIEEDFGEQITLEERDAQGMMIYTPFMILKVSLYATFLTSDYESIAPILQQSVEGAPPPLRRKGLLMLHEEEISHDSTT